MTAWKHLERRVARAIGGRRVGHLGGADVIAPGLSIECKYRASLPQWLTDAMSQAVRHSDGLPAAVVVGLHGQRVDDCLVVMRFGDWVDTHTTGIRTPADGGDTAGGI